MDAFDKQDPLWETLGKARPVKVSTGFARRVRRAATQEEKAPDFSFRQFLRWLFPIGSAVAVAALWIFVIAPDDSSLVATEDDTFDSMVAISSLVSYDDGSVWSEIVFY